MLDLRTRLTELCQEHELGVELVTGIDLPEQVLDRALAECERVLEAGPSASAQDLARLRRLVRFARETRELQRVTTEDSLRDEEQELERLNASLEQAQEEIGKLEHQLEGTLNSMESPSEPGREDVFVELAQLCHKINNPLTAVMGRAQMLKLKLTQAGDEKSCRTIGIIEESSQRVAAYVQELALVCNRNKAGRTGR